MNCPNCGNEMRAGFLHTGVPCIWSPKAVKHSRIKGKEDIYILGGLSDALIGYSTESAPAAHICTDCCKVIIDY